MEVCLKTAAMHMTIFLLTLLAVDRYISIVWNGLRRSRSIRNYRLIVICLWVLSIIVCIPTIRWFKYDQAKNLCYVSWEDEVEDGNPVLTDPALDGCQGKP